MKQDLWKYSARELLKGYKKKIFDCVDVANSIIIQIKKLNEKINAFVYFNEQDVIDQAVKSKKRWESGKLLGKLEGIPISIKDLIITKDYPTFRGSYNNSLPTKSEVNAPVVEKLIKSGAVLLGKTATPEFGHKGTTASKRYGETLNPWNLKTNAGGSSGGSSAAVASGMGPLSIGTDGGGSVRIPCSFCGLFGHKPTFGRIPAYPISPFGTVANIGPIARNAMDGAILMDVISKPDNNDWYSLPEEKISYYPKKYKNEEEIKIGYTNFWGMDKFIPGLELDKQVEEVYRNALNVLSSKNYNFVKYIDIDWPNNPEMVFKTIWHTGAANLARRISSGDLMKIDPNFLKFVKEGKKYSSFDIMETEAFRAENGVHIEKIFAELDFIIGPTLPITAIEAGCDVPKLWDESDIFAWTPFTYPLNLTKNPASTINCGFSKDGLPVGLQIVAPIYRDHSCIRFANHLERVLDLSTKWPDIVV